MMKFKKVVEEVVEDNNTAKLIIDATQVSATNEVNAASIATTVSAAAIIMTKDFTLAQALVEIKTSKPKEKAIMIEEPQKQQKKKGTNHQHKLNKKIMCTYLKNMEGKKLKDLKNKSFDSIQKMFDRAFNRVNTFVDFKTDLVEGSSKRVGEELKQESAKKKKVDDNKETA
nr:hypothetical protein [Tanacetum cinerariifolium]